MELAETTSELPVGIVSYHILVMNEGTHIGCEYANVINFTPVVSLSRNWHGFSK